MVKQFLKALDCGFTAFINELYLPTFGFPLLSDSVADALEDEPVLKSSGGFKRGPVSSPVVEPGSAPGVVSPEAPLFPEAGASGHLTKDDVRQVIREEVELMAKEAWDEIYKHL
jgi:hypothetical protein